jgi:hypothetical protein
MLAVAAVALAAFSPVVVHDRAERFPLASAAAHAPVARSAAAPPAVYGRAVPARGGGTWLQYWLFYAYQDQDRGIVRSGRHVADWELVQYRLDAEYRPVEAVYAQHGGGERCGWDEVEKRGGSPVVYVAHGSHANYFRPGIHKHDLACYPQAARAIFRANAIAPVDYSAATPTMLPQLLPISAATPDWSPFPGAWGERGFFHAPGVNTVAFGYGPYGPQFHSVWRAPVKELARWRLSR